MTFAGTDQVHTSLPAWHRLARVGGAMAATAVLLSACGGGDQVNPFRAKNMVSFGDENSALVEVPVGGGGAVTSIKGFKYGVNSTGWAPTPDATEVGARTVAGSQPAWVFFPTVPPVTNTLNLTAAANGAYLLQQDFSLDTAFTASPTAPVTVRYTYTYYCADYPLWVQSLARNYGLGYQQQCPAENASGAVTYAAPGATVSDTAAQFNAHRGELNSNTLTTIMAGQNDILAAYAQVKAGKDLDDARAEMTAKGKELAAVINGIYGTGAHVLFVKLPNLGFSPLARADTATNGPARLTALTLAFNNGVLTNVRNDGLRIGLVNFYDQTFDIERYPSIAGVNDISSSVCSSTVYKPDGSAVAATPSVPGGDSLLYCNSLTIDRSAEGYFWSDSFNLAPRAHAFLGLLAYRRAFDEVF